VFACRKMASYCGCETRANRFRWAIVLFFCLCVFCFFIGWLVESTQCKYCRGTVCTEEPPGTNDGDYDSMTPTS
jgi:hypothetical protein